MATATLVCSSCNDAEVELFYCETCTDSQENLNDEKELLCELCLGPHIGKGHQVRSSKGQEPLICSQHRRLHNEYCKTCDVSFCSKCLKEHSKHEMGSTDERAIEIKKEVFEMLTKLELDEKPLRAKKESISEMKKIHQDEQLQLKELFENEIEKLRQVGLKRIEENLRQFENKEKEVIDSIDHVVSLQKSARDLLILTSPHLINNFKRVKLGFEDMNEKCQEALKAECKGKSSEFCKIKEIFENMGEEIYEKLKSMFAENSLLQSSIKFAAIGSDWSSFVFLAEKGKVKIDRLKLSVVNTLECENVHEVEFNQEISSFISINDFNYLCSCVILTNSSAYRINIAKNGKVMKLELVLPQLGGIVCNYTLENETSQVYCCYWLQDQKELRFSHNDAFKIQCTSMPKWESRELQGYRLCFRTERNDVLIVDLKRSVHEIIPFSKYRFESISHFTLLSTHLFIWSIETKSITCMRKSAHKWSVVETEKWLDATELIELQCFPLLLFLPALKNNSSRSNESNEDGDDYQFLVFSAL